ncbi:hypothetical protein ACU5AX_18460 [Sphingomonas sp. XXL09]|uniref:hypothetical protein n=1 Tax=Sphingomonas sp. XXL09 TaxID=3457787 RepID=UPI00406BB955
MASISAHRTDNHEPLDLRSNLLFGFSWLLVMAVGLMPLAEAVLHRSLSITMPTTIAFFIAVGSGVMLRRHYTWVGVVLHIYGQIAIWLSLFVMSLAIVLALLGHK